jgi:hypothetical protein
MSSLTRCVHLNPPQRIETPRVQCSGDLIAVPADPSHMIKTTASSILARSRFFFFFFSFSSSCDVPLKEQMGLMSRDSREE